ncbi:hypothetical protein BDEG_26265 [Batrachochytrium dendrobatidis JEL423]|uniref:F-actin-capping protein subunit alpha n=1 Tax=Batrachochytrium dendrobatidis (strain JEL423) TaxID=403673 RepID=A0A177WTB3_BATDL|nr:hypothetical protein BDEG_26265 [Batrachochytrium dendrobatidis JEL423]
MTATDAEKLEIVSGFIKDSPPGEINDVFNGRLILIQYSVHLYSLSFILDNVRSLVADDSLLQNTIESTFADHHAKQLVSVQVPSKDYEVILGEYGCIEPSKYVDPRSGQALIVDLVHQTVKSVEPYHSKCSAHLLDQRAALDVAVQEYTASFYPSSVCTVWATEDEALVIAIVANKYHPDSFWSGRWRSLWRLEPKSSMLTGSAKVQVHYYEDGKCSAQ